MFSLGLASVSVTLSVCISSDRTFGSELEIKRCRVLTASYLHFVRCFNNTQQENHQPRRCSAERKRGKTKTQMCTFLLPFILRRDQSRCQLLLSGAATSFRWRTAVWQIRRAAQTGKKNKLLRVLSVSDDRRVHRSNHNTERPPSTHRPPLPSEWQAEDNNTTVSLHLSPPYLLVFSLPRGLTSSSRLLWCRRQLCWISQDAAVSSSLARVCWCVWEVFVIVVILYLAALWFIKEDQIWKCLCG